MAPAAVVLLQFSYQNAQTQIATALHAACSSSAPFSEEGKRRRQCAGGYDGRRGFDRKCVLSPVCRFSDSLLTSQCFLCDTCQGCVFRLTWVPQWRAGLLWGYGRVWLSHYLDTCQSVTENTLQRLPDPQPFCTALATKREHLCVSVVCSSMTLSFSLSLSVVSACVVGAELRGYSSRADPRRHDPRQEDAEDRLQGRRGH
jgi:hypothetical protein